MLLQVLTRFLCLYIGDEHVVFNLLTLSTSYLCNLIPFQGTYNIETDKY